MDLVLLRLGDVTVHCTRHGTAGVLVLPLEAVPALGGTLEPVAREPSPSPPRPSPPAATPSTPRPALAPEPETDRWSWRRPSSPASTGAVSSYSGSVSPAPRPSPPRASPPRSTGSCPSGPRSSPPAALRPASPPRSRSPASPARPAQAKRRARRGGRAGRAVHRRQERAQSLALGRPRTLFSAPERVAAVPTASSPFAPTATSPFGRPPPVASSASPFATAPLSPFSPSPQPRSAFSAPVVQLTQPVPRSLPPWRPSLRRQR
jgi:hypothetical protein